MKVDSSDSLNEGNEFIGRRRVHGVTARCSCALCRQDVLLLWKDALCMRFLAEGLIAGSGSFVKAPHRSFEPSTAGTLSALAKGLGTTCCVNSCFLKLDNLHPGRHQLKMSKAGIFSSPHSNHFGQSRQGTIKQHGRFSRGAMQLGLHRCPAAQFIFFVDLMFLVSLSHCQLWLGYRQRL